MGKDNRTPDRIQAVWNILGGEEGVDRLLAGKLKLVEAQPREFTVWRTVKLGLHKNPKNYRVALKSSKIMVGRWADDILGRTPCSQEQVHLDLVVMSPDDLGFKNSALYADICAKAVELGLELCPAEVGPALRLQYGGQTQSEWALFIAMEAIADRIRDRNIFRVEYNGAGQWLHTSLGHPDFVYGARNRFVFVRPKKQQ